MNLISEVLSKNDNANFIVNETALKNTIKRIKGEKKSLVGKIFAMPISSLRPLAVLADYWRDGYCEGWSDSGRYTQTWNEVYS